MARRSKPAPELVNAIMFTVCTQCGYKIHPSELLYTDGKRCRCPKCGKDFEPEQEGYGGVNSQKTT